MKEINLKWTSNYSNASVGSRPLGCNHENSDIMSFYNTEFEEEGGGGGVIIKIFSLSAKVQ